MQEGGASMADIRWIGLESHLIAIRMSCPSHTARPYVHCDASTVADSPNLQYGCMVLSRPCSSHLFSLPVSPPPTQQHTARIEVKLTC